MLTVLQIIPNLGAGGAEQACIDIARGLKARGDRALVISAGGSRIAELETLGGEHFTMPVASKNPLKILQNAFKLRDFIRAQKVDFIHARSRAPAWSAWLASRFAPCAFVTTFHAAYKFSSAVKRFYNSVMARGDAVIAISHYIAEHIAKIYGASPDKIITIYRGIDVDKFSIDAVTENRKNALRFEWSLKPETKIILVPARLSPIKGQALVIEAMAQMARQFPDLVAVIVGDDQGRVSYRSNLEQLIKQYNLSHNVRMASHCSDMPAAYALAAVVAVPSCVPEGFGRVPVEAMALGVPVVASNIGAVPETIVENVTGWLLPPSDASAWAAAFAKALALTPEEKAQRAILAIKRVRTHFNHRHMVAETLAVYDELMAMHE